jgi:thioredoxin reductase (NADPH)
MNNKDLQTTDVVIIGAGPVGLFAAFECGMLGLKCCVVDALPHVGGQCMALYPEKPIFDIPALPRVTAAELISRLMEQAAPFNPSFLCGVEIKRFERGGSDRWQIGLSDGVQIECAAVIVATGAGRLRPNKPNWIGLDRFEGKGVHYSVLEKDRFSGRTVVIAGGGDSAADWSVELAAIASKVFLLHRRDHFRAAPDTLKKIQRLAEAGSIELIAPAKVHALHGDDRLQSMEIEVAGMRRRIECDDALLFFGLVSEGSPYAEWGLETDRFEIAVNAKTNATNLPGVFAIGDVATRPSKLKLILAGFSEAATAAHQAFKFCRPGEELFVEYSTAKGIPT